MFAVSFCIVDDACLSLLLSDPAKSTKLKRTTDDGVFEVENRVKDVNDEDDASLADD